MNTDSKHFFISLALISNCAVLALFANVQKYPTLTFLPLPQHSEGELKFADA